MPPWRCPKSPERYNFHREQFHAAKNITGHVPKFYLLSMVALYIDVDSYWSDSRVVDKPPIASLWHVMVHIFYFLSNQADKANKGGGPRPHYKYVRSTSMKWCQKDTFDIFSQIHTFEYNIRISVTSVA